MQHERRQGPVGRRTAPLSAVSIVAVVAVVVGAAVTDRNDLIVPLMFVFVSMLTMPHLLVVERIWSNPAREDRVGRRWLPSGNGTR